MPKKGGDWHTVIVRNTQSHQKTEEAGRILPLKLWTPESRPADTMVLDFWPAQLSENKFLLFQTTNFVIIYMAPTGN